MTRANSPISSSLSARGLMKSHGPQPTASPAEAIQTPQQSILFLVSQPLPPNPGSLPTAERNLGGQLSLSFRTALGPRPTRPSGHEALRLPTHDFPLRTDPRSCMQAGLLLGLFSFLLVSFSVSFFLLCRVLLGHGQPWGRVLLETLLFQSHSLYVPPASAHLFSSAAGQAGRSSPWAYFVVDVDSIP